MNVWHSDVYPEHGRWLWRHVFQSNTLLDVNWETGMVRRLDLSSFLESAAKSVTSHFKTQQVRDIPFNHFKLDVLPATIVL